MQYPSHTRTFPFDDIVRNTFSAKTLHCLERKQDLDFTSTTYLTLYTWPIFALNLVVLRMCSSHIVKYTLHVLHTVEHTLASNAKLLFLLVLPHLYYPQRFISYIQPLPAFIHHKADTVYMTLHLLPPVGSPGFCDFSISAIICSNAFPTLLFNRALASVKLQLNSSASFLPSSAWTWRWSALRSLLFPTMTKGTQSAPYGQVRRM